MSTKRRSAECCYCGLVGPVTADHVPPKCLFAPNNRSELVKVDACRGCNGGFAKDDEYFRNMLSMRDDVVDVPDARVALDAAVRSLGREGQARLRAATMRNIRFAEKSQSGIVLGQRLAYGVDLARMSGVAERTVRGLFRHEFGHRVPPGYEVLVRAVDGLHTDDIRALIGLRQVSQMALSGGLRSIGGGAFEYGVTRMSDDPEATVWTLCFYGKVFFTGLTGAEADINRLRRRGDTKRIVAILP